MKKLLLITLFVASFSSFAQADSTYSQRTAEGMKDVLNSSTVQEVLSQEDGMGSLKGIKYLYSGRAIFGPAIYELSFVSFQHGGSYLCEVAASLNLVTKVVGLSSKPECTLIGDN